MTMPALTIRLFLTAVIACMGLTLIVLTGQSMLSDIQRSTEAQRVASLTKISQALWPAFIAARIERGTQIPALLGAAPATEAAWHRLDVNRNITDTSLADSLAQLRRVALPDGPALSARLTASHDQLAAFRPSVDAAIRLPLSRRDPNLLGQYRQIAGQYIDNLAAATDDVEASLKLFDPQIDQLLSIKRAAWATRSYGGLLSVQIENAAAAERPWNDAEIVTAAEYRGRADLAWSIVNEITRRPEVPADLRAAIEAANAAASGPLATAQKSVIEDLGHGRKARQSVAELQVLNTQLLNYVVAVLKVALTSMVNQAQDYANAAKWHLILSASMVGAVTLLTGFGIFVVNRRVSTPIRRITDLMRRLADLETNVEIATSGRRDEIGEMTQALLVFRREIEDRSRRQKEREMQRFLETMIDAMPVYISFKDRDLRYLYVNQARRQLIREGEIVGKRLSEVVSPALAAVGEEIDLRILATGEAEHFEQVWMGPADRPAVIWSLKAPFRDQHGVVAGIITCGVDITRLKETEAELISQREAAESANRGKSIFLANMSHELRTPLNAIIGFAEMLMAGYLGQINERQQDYVINIRRSGEHLLQVVNDLLDLSRLEAGRVELHVTYCPFDRIAVAALGMIRPQAEKTGIELAFTPTNLMLHADERALTQILVNLLGNAVKFSSSGCQVVLRATPTTAGIRIEVEDNGIGMTNEQCKVALMPTADRDPFRARPKGGAGLGLSISRRLVELHHGRLDISSQPGLGSVVSILLPEAV